MGIKVKVDQKTRKLVIEADIDEVLSPSKSGKTLLLATSNGNLRTDQTYNGEPVTVGLNVYIPNKG